MISARKGYFQLCLSESVTLWLSESRIYALASPEKECLADPEGARDSRAQHLLSPEEESFSHSSSHSVIPKHLILPLKAYVEPQSNHPVPAE